MSRSFALLSALFAVAQTACLVQQRPPPDPCSPNPCTGTNRTRCVNEDGNAVCLCNDGFIARPSGVCEPVSDANCPSHPGDAAEPDDCLAHARAFEPGSPPASQSIHPVGDYDYFGFSGTLDHVVVATAKTSGPLVPRIDLFDQSGVAVATAEGVGTVRLAAKLRASGTYALRVMHSPLDPSVATGDYTFTLESLGTEDHGDGPDFATHIAADVSGTTPVVRYGKFEFPDDQDWFRFTADDLQNYRLVFESGRTLPWVSLWAPGDTDTPRWTVRQEVVDFDVPSDGTSFLSVHPPDGNGGSYGFTFVRAPK